MSEDTSDASIETSSEVSTSPEPRTYTENELQDRLQNVARNVKKEVSAKYERNIKTSQDSASSQRSSGNSVSSEVSDNSAAINAAVESRVKEEIEAQQRANDRALADSQAKEVFSRYVKNVSEPKDHPDFKEVVNSLTKEEHEELAILTHDNPNQSDLVYYYAKNPDAFLQVRNAIATNNFTGANRVISQRSSMIENSKKSKQQFSSKAPSPLSKISNEPAQVDVQPRSSASARRHQMSNSRRSN